MFEEEDDTDEGRYLKQLNEITCTKCLPFASADELALYKRKLEQSGKLTDSGGVADRFLGDGRYARHGFFLERGALSSKQSPP